MKRVNRKYQFIVTAILVCLSFNLLARKLERPAPEPGPSSDAAYLWGCSPRKITKITAENPMESIKSTKGRYLATFVVKLYTSSDNLSEKFTGQHKLNFEKALEEYKKNYPETMLQLTSSSKSGPYVYIYTRLYLKDTGLQLKNLNDSKQTEKRKMNPSNALKTVINDYVGRACKELELGNSQCTMMGWEKK